MLKTKLLIWRRVLQKETNRSVVQPGSRCMMPPDFWCDSTEVITFDKHILFAHSKLRKKLGCGSSFLCFLKVRNWGSSCWSARTGLETHRKFAFAFNRTTFHNQRLITRICKVLEILELLEEVNYPSHYSTDFSSLCLMSNFTTNC